MEQKKLPSEKDQTSQTQSKNPIAMANSAENPNNTIPHSTKADIKKQKYAKFNLWWKHDGIQAILALTTICTLIAYILVSRQQNAMTREAIRRSDSANKEALKLTKQAAYLSEEALKHSIISDSENGILSIKDTLARDRNTKMELRAYLYFQDIIDKIPQIGQKITLGAKLINIGKTAAHDVRTHIMSKMGTGMYEPDWKVIDKLLAQQQGVVIGVGQVENPGNVNRNFTSDDSVMIYTGQRKYFIYGKTKYIDDFNISRYTRFCLVYDTADRVFVRYNRYNDAN